jgi:hypothetical protein
LAAIFALSAFAACGGVRNDAPPRPADAWSAEPPVPAGGEGEPSRSEELLDGSYELAAPAAASLPAAYVFTDDGAFSRRWPAEGEVVRQQEGTYLIDSGGRLLLFVERTGAGMLSTAELETVGFRRDGDGSITLTTGAVDVTYRRTGPAPSRPPERPSAE